MKIQTLNYTGDAETGVAQGEVELAGEFVPGSTNTPLLGSSLAQGVVVVDEPEQQTVEATILELGLTGYQRVRRLMQVMEQPTPNEVAWPPEDVFRLRVKLDLEEQFEKLVDGYYLGDPNMILDGACDVEVVGIGSMVAFGVNYDLAIAEVDRSNLSKLGEDGRPIKNEFGKFLKGPNYTPPDLKQFLFGLENVPAPYDTKQIVREELTKVILKYAAKHWDLFHPVRNGLQNMLTNPGATPEQCYEAAMTQRGVLVLEVDASKVDVEELKEAFNNAEATTAEIIPIHGAHVAIFTDADNNGPDSLNEAAAAGVVLSESGNHHFPA